MEFCSPEDAALRKRALPDLSERSRELYISEIVFGEGTTLYRFNAFGEANVP